jgi:hypothetical protein
MIVSWRKGASRERMIKDIRSGFFYGVEAQQKWEGN